ncbi:hypothetical protein QVD99_002541 [Batrachochytrium dendrobatidis]|nr:hypothetical protein O5D80_006770 [Batrachochytrium dendrobatidis]KAK5670770.1 hypothetical protein QVD99_002541 [Batrachochytrium dendrobatidis]
MSKLSKHQRGNNGIQRGYILVVETPPVFWNRFDSIKQTAVAENGSADQIVWQIGRVNTPDCCRSTRDTNNRCSSHSSQQANTPMVANIHALSPVMFLVVIG